MAFLLGALVLPVAISCTKPDDGGSGNTDDPETPITPIDPINPVDPNTPEDIWGVYNPGKKIKKVYRSSSNQEKYLGEVWNWNGDLLESIDYYSQGTIWSKEQYYYDENNRIIRVEELYYPSEVFSVSKFEYEGNFLKTVYVFGLDGKYSFAYQGDKLKEIVYEGEPKKGRSEQIYLVYHISWSDDNLASLLVKEMDNDPQNLTIDYLYDAHHNPFYGFFNRMSHFGDISHECSPFNTMLSKNNVTKADYLETEKHSFESFEYQYDTDGYPIKIVKVGNYESTTYYEYE